MAINADVMEIIRILDEEEFGWLAGELLTEISLGRASDEQQARKILSETEDEEEPDPGVREPVPDDEQLGEAVAMMRLRLVAPARALADAERIAGSFDDRQAVRIRFADADDAYGEGAEIEAAAGDATVADKLDDVLGRILDGTRNLEV
jgi:hypothetical protein